MSVDTYLKGKDTSSYLRATRDDVEVLVSPAMARWSQRVRVGVKGALFWRGLDVHAEHAHGPACQH
ncbi:MAG: hypothetical protein ACLFRD_05920 [Nitriliruptoraceae bacterium]